MAQLFKPGANTIATASLFAGALAPFAIFLGGSQLSRSAYNTKVDVPIDQPIPFSHKHHVVELGIDCRFCHWTVEKGAAASVPTTDVCMTCHSQVWTNSPMLDPLRTSWETNTPIQWNKVNTVPDFVYFDHSIHIARGVSCNNCHGAINEMQITWKGNAFRMAWCLECHREPEKYLFKLDDEPTMTPREQVFQIYKKLSTGQTLTPVEGQLAKGLAQIMPKDKNHEGVELMKERGINKTQMMDCYVCHH